MIATALHIGIIFGGSDWYRFFGAGEEMAVMSEQGSWLPQVMTLTIAMILLLWACYAFSGAGLLPRLPLLRPTLLVITTIYLVRGLALIPLWLGWPEQINAFWVWSSLICLLYGLFYAAGSWQVWVRIGHANA